MRVRVGGVSMLVLEVVAVVVLVLVLLLVLGTSGDRIRRIVQPETWVTF
jgi:hypothetical protein